MVLTTTKVCEAEYVAMLCLLYLARNNSKEPIDIILNKQNKISITRNMQYNDNCLPICSRAVIDIIAGKFCQFDKRAFLGT